MTMENEDRFLSLTHLIVEHGKTVRKYRRVTSYFDGLFEENHVLHVMSGALGMFAELRLSRTTVFVNPDVLVSFYTVECLDNEVFVEVNVSFEDPEKTEEETKATVEKYLNMLKISPKWAVRDDFVAQLYRNRGSLKDTDETLPQ